MCPSLAFCGESNGSCLAVLWSRRTLLEGDGENERCGDRSITEERAMSDASAPFFPAEEGVQECERESLPRFGLSFLVEDAFVLGTQGFSWFATTAACRVAPPRINNPWSMDLVSVVAVASVAGVGDEDGFRLGGERSPLRNAICDLFSCSLNTDVADLTDFCGVKMSLTPSERNAVFIVVPSERNAAAVFIVVTVRNYLKILFNTVLLGVPKSPVEFRMVTCE
jgi:hypothetical protein